MAIEPASAAPGSALPASRTAVVIDADSPPGRFRLAQIPLPQCAPDELLVEVHAAGVNAIDRIVSNAMHQVPAFMRKAPGYVSGKDISGTVVAVGSGVSDFKVGDAIFGMGGVSLSPAAAWEWMSNNLARGAFTTHTTLKAKDAAKKPGNLTHVEAAGIPLAGLTAWQAVVETAKLREGDKLLIWGGAGGVGTLAIQLAKRYCKAGTVAVTCSGSSAPLVKRCGADVVIDYRRENFEDVLKDGNYDAVLDAVSYNDKFRRAAAVLKPKAGRLVDLIGPPSIGYLDRREAKESMWSYTMQRMQYGGKVRYRFVGVAPDGQALRAMAKLLEEGTIKPVVDKVYKGLDNVQAAFDYVKSGAAHGKVVVSVKD